MKTEGCPYKMKPLDSCCAGIDYQHISFHVTDNLEYMGVSAHKDIRTILINELSGTGIIFPRIPSYMGHQYLQAATLKEAVHRVDKAEVMVIAVSGHTDKRLVCGYPFRKLHPASEITGMPYLVDRLKKLPELAVENTVRI